LAEIAEHTYGWGSAPVGRPSTALARARTRPPLPRHSLSKEKTVDEEVFNMSVRKFLKNLGVTAQREIELAVREQLERNDLQGDETLDATATVTVAGVSREIVVTGKISLS
jgi:Family of unknown function (DUF6494)